MKIKTLFWNWSNAIKTFPISHVLLVVITVLWICEVEWFVDLEWEELFALFLAFLVSCYWPLFLIHSNLKNKNIINRVLQVLSIILWLIYYFILYRVDVFDLNYAEALLYVRVLPLTFLWISLLIALFYRKQQSKIWFSRTSLFVSIVFWLIAWSIVRWWISGALASIEALFDINIDWNIYSDIWFISEILLAGSFIFNYYLTLIEELDRKSDFVIKPFRLRKIFWSFIFLPLALIYLVIFCAYWIKILITWVWPKWIIVLLWIWYFSLWIVSSYLVYPDKNKVHEIINNILYVSFILIAFMMIWAITKRINQYGITINRCFVCYIIAFIIIFSLLSLIFSSKRLLSFISTLFVLSFVSVYLYPINVGNISFNSQLNRLETLLSKYNISIPLNQWDLKELDEESTKLTMWVIDELVQNYSKDKIINKIINFEYENWYRSSRSDIREFLGVNTDYDYYYPTIKYRSYYWSDNDWLDVSWFSKLYSFEEYYGGLDSMVLKLNVEDQDYYFDLSLYTDKFKEKWDIYQWRIESNGDLSWPAFVLEENNYKLVVTSFSLQEAKEWDLLFNTIKWYILFK